jgi:hypothetical protein
MKNYLPLSIHLYMIMVIVLGYYGGFYIFALSVFVIYLLFNFLLRKGHKSLGHKIGGVSEAVLSPVTGMIKDISPITNHPLFGHDLIRLTIHKSWFDAGGLFIPLTSEISNRHTVENQQSQGESGEILVFRCEQGTKVGIHFPTTWMGNLATNWLEIGDRGERGANFGFIPLGGRILLYLPNSYRILVSEGEKIFGEETAVAVPPAASERENE